MVEHGHIGRANQTWMAVPADSEWPRYVLATAYTKTGYFTDGNRLRKTGEWSDFTITAGNKLFAAHRVKSVYSCFHRDPLSNLSTAGSVRNHITSMLSVLEHLR